MTQKVRSGAIDMRSGNPSARRSPEKNGCLANSVCFFATWISTCFICVPRGWSASVPYGDDARSRALCCPTHEGELDWRTRTRDALELIGRELAHRGKEAVSARLVRETAHEPLHG